MGFSILDGFEDPLRARDGKRFRPDGTFEVLHGWGGETIEVVASAPGFAPGSVGAVPEEGSEEVRVDLVLRPAREVCGVVVASDGGAPIAGARVAVGVGRRGLVDWENGPPAPPVHATTDGEGRFVIAGVSPGKWTVHVEAPGRVAADTPVEVPLDGPVRVALAPALSLSGRVLYRDGTSPGSLRITARPLEGYSRGRIDTAEDGRFLIRGLPPAGAGSGGGSHADTDDEGRFRITGLEPGEFRLDVAVTAPQSA